MRRSTVSIPFAHPILFVGLFGEGLQATLGSSLGYNYLTFVFLGVFAETLFQSTALGITSLIEDRENDLCAMR